MKGDRVSCFDKVWVGNGVRNTIIQPQNSEHRAWNSEHRAWNSEHRA
jgi:hypothetical protein